MLFYIVNTPSGEFNISPLQTSDKPHHDFDILLPGLPLGFAQDLLHRIKASGKERRKKEVLKTLQKYPGLSGMDFHWEKVQSHSLYSLQPEEGIRRVIQGRQLSEADLHTLGNEIGLTFTQVLEGCDLLVQDGKAEWLPAVQREGSGWRCIRCGEERVEEWVSIYGEAATCPSCASIGAISSLQAVYRSKAQITEDKDQPIAFTPRWELSPAQKKASEAVLNFLTLDGQKEVLLWAACGAGKTEVCFPAAALALNRGRKVLFAAPRQDVVLDVAPRLKRDFPEVNLSILTGTSLERFAPAQFVLATTHQVMRFYEAFDLVFLDEMDAFPFHGNPALTWGLQQALKVSGKMIYLTATPSPESLENVRKGKMQIIRLPARHHRRPLPVPEWIKGGREFEQENVQPELVDCIKKLAEAGPLLLFVPKISWVNPWVNRLIRVFPQWEIAGSYSSDPQRREKIEGLRNKKFRIFVSTSILERGVTLPNAQVIVLAADHEIFDERALVQMAGRVGRTQENPEGRALFFSKTKTPGIEKAIRWIKEQNALARAQGLID